MLKKSVDQVQVRFDRGSGAASGTHNELDASPRSSLKRIASTKTTTKKLLKVLIIVWSFVKKLLAAGVGYCLG